MKKEEILEASRKEHKARDLAELEASAYAGYHAGRIGALVCCLISLAASHIGKIILYSPWVIYFSILSANWLFRFFKLKNKSDLVLSLLFLILTVLAFGGLLRRLMEICV